MGRRLVWASSVSLAVVDRAPMTSLATLHWMRASLVVTFTKSSHLAPLAGLWTLVNHTSAA